MPTLRSADTYFKIYQTYVKSMPIQDRVNYLMAGVRLLDIDGGELDGFWKWFVRIKPFRLPLCKKWKV